MSEVEIPEEGQPVVEEQPSTPAPPIESRFLFVDVSALRAKQLRRGAKVRLPEWDPEDAAAPQSSKPERVAMDEVQQRLVHWTLPEFKALFDIR